MEGLHHGYIKILARNSRTGNSKCVLNAYKTELEGPLRVIIFYLGCLLENTDGGAKCLLVMITGDGMGATR